MTYESDADEILAESRAEAIAQDRADRDWDGYETARSEDRYLTGFGWDK